MLLFIGGKQKTQPDIENHRYNIPILAEERIHTNYNWLLLVRFIRNYFTVEIIHAIELKSSQFQIGGRTIVNIELKFRLLAYEQFRGEPTFASKW